MKQKLIIGRYLPYDSFVHRLDPRSKLLATILYISIIFFANNWLTYLLLTLVVLLGIYLSKVPFDYFVKGVRPMLVLFLFTAFLQILITPGRTTYFSVGFIQISQEGIQNGVFVFARFVLIIFMSILLTLTTEALRLTDAIDYFLTPLKKLDVPVHDMALMLSIGLRFVPTLMDEAEKIMNAQRARGMDFSEGTWLDKLKNFAPLLVPLFNSSYDRAFDLATAMEARDYQGGKGRSKYRQLTWHFNDSLVILFFIAFLLLVLSVRS